MTTPVTFKNQKVYHAEVVVNDLASNPNNNIYLTTHRTQAWANDSSPPVANSNYSTIFDLWDNMIFGKKITRNDIYHVVPRYNWTANTTYAEVDQSYDYSNSQFYVLTSDYNIYKCISNNAGNISTVEPTSLLTDNITQTADGYKWKYISTLTDTEQERFLSDDYMPVRTLVNDDFTSQWDVQQNATAGAIYHINITDGGVNYSNNSNLTVRIVGNGSGANATANINTQSNTIHTITMDAYGAGYSYANVSISGGGGTGATLYPLLSPPGGHGKDPKYELNAHYLMFDLNIAGSEGGELVANNDFRQISILLNPYKYSTTNLMSNSVFTQYTTIQLASTGGNFYNDEYVYIGSSLQTATFSGVVYNWDESNSKIHLINTRGSISSDLLNGSESTAARFVTSDIIYPEVTPFTGKTLFVENIEPITRSNDQTEEFRIILKF